jgi:hypothetical protein
VASSAWERRNAAARARGFKNVYDERNQRAIAAGFQSYYDYRARNYGKTPGRARGGELRVLRGHAGKQDLIDRARPGGSIVSRIIERDNDGRRTKIEVQYADDRGMRSFFLTGDLSDAAMSDLRDILEEADVDVDPYEAVWG